MQTRMERLIDVIERIEPSDFPPKDVPYTEDECTTIYQELITLAEELLITADGRPYHSRMEHLKKLGYRCFPAEQDSFGWLVGGISIPGKGTAYYG